MKDNTIIFSPSPHIHTARSTQAVMRNVLIALLPSVFCALFFFGLPSLAVLFVSTATSVLTEWCITRYMLHRHTTIGDYSALLTGVLLALNLPANIPLHMVAIGAIVAIGIAKMAFGGLGCNIFNPALVGRVFLLISFPVAMTTWPVPDSFFSDADGVTGATTLSLVKTGQANIESFSYLSMFMGNMGGSMGEISTLAILIGFAYLLITGVIKWYIPVSIIVGLAFVDILCGYPVVFDILSGGLLFGAVFMATDYVTSPMTRNGMLLYGLLIGIITAVIRRWGAYPEGTSFAILIMNGATPLINRYMRPLRFSPNRKEAKR